LASQTVTLQENISRETGPDKPFLKFLSEIGLLTLAAFLFSFSFPSGISHTGLFPLGFFALIPLFIVVHRSNWGLIFLYGIYFGFLSYSIFNFWLVRFHPLAIFIVPTIYAVYFLLFLPLLKLIDNFFPKYGYIWQMVLWIAYEYLKTTRFLGYSYGIMGYTQYLFLPLIRFSALTGVFGVSFFVVFPSVYFGNALKNGIKDFHRFLKSHRIDLIIYALLFIAVLLYGIIDKEDFSSIKNWRVALIQHNVDPWKNDYEESLELLIELSREALKENPEIVVWSETSFIPAIQYHTRHRTNQEAYDLVHRLRDFLSVQEVPYVIGNDDGELQRLGGTKRVDYNASLLYKDGDFQQIYRKTHLVPFTEHFPYEKQLPGIYRMLEEADTHFWEKGDEYTVFSVDGIQFSTPICFEDTFGYLSREFIRNGADVIVNLTNDSWSHSIPSEIQHMSMAVFRAVENKRSVVRSTNGGITCAIDPNGKIIDRIDPFIEGHLVTDVPVFNKKDTLYTKWGDWLGITSVYGALVLIAFGIIRTAVRRRRKSN